MRYEIKEESGFKYIEEGSGENLVLLHGLFGALSNWEMVLTEFKNSYHVVIPILPIYDMPLRQAGVNGIVKYFTDFVELKQLDQMILVGNSLGGHIGLVYALNSQEKLKSLVLTGSSGLFENAMGGSYPKRGSYEYIKERAQYTFYNPETVTDEYVDEVFAVTKSIPKCLNIVAIAKSAQRHNMAEDIPTIKVPTLLIWGLNDTITPPMVAHDFNRLIPNSTLKFIDYCCHAPMMESSDYFNKVLKDFLLDEKAIV